MKPREVRGCVLALQVGNHEIVENKDKAQAFLDTLDTFFPKMDEPDEVPPVHAPVELPWPPVTELEIQRSLKTAKSSTAPGDDDVPTLVWKNLWGTLKKVISEIFTASLNLGYKPSRWRRAKIAYYENRGSQATRFPDPTAQYRSLTH